LVWGGGGGGGGCDTNVGRSTVLTDASDAFSLFPSYANIII